jgi:hypothetical protein
MKWPAPSVRQRFGAGAILNLQSSDALAVASLLYYIHYAWAGPLQFVIAMALLYRELGPPALVGVAVAVALIPAQSKLGSLTSARGKTAAAHADARLVPPAPLSAAKPARSHSACAPAMTSAALSAGRAADGAGRRAAPEGNGGGGAAASAAARGGGGRYSAAAAAGAAEAARRGAQAA